MMDRKASRKTRLIFINESISLICFLSVLLGYSFSYSQSFNPIFNQISPKNGLNNRHNEFIKKDSKGFLWISSTDGLYRFDGFNLKHYSSNGNNGMLGKNIQSNFIEDRKGDIWFTTYKGINQYIRKKDSFKSYQLKDPKGKELDVGYNLFYIENDSILWLGVGTNIYKYNPYSNTQSLLLSTEGVRFEINTYLNGHLKTIIACPWISNSGVQFISFDSLGKYKSQYFFKDGIPDKPNLPVEISKAIIENDSLVWLFSNLGLLELNPFLSDSVKTYPLPRSNNDLAKDGVNLNSRYLLVGTKNSGLWLFDKQNRIYKKSYFVKENSKESLSTNSLREILFDENEFLWLSHYYEPAIDYSWVRNNHFINPFETLKGYSPAVNSILEDNQSRIWCSTENSGIYVFRNEKLIKHYPYKTDTINNTLSLNKIKQLSLDSKGRVWGLSNQSVFYFQDGHWSIFFNSQDKIYSHVHSLNSSVIISTNKGLFELSYSSNLNEKTVKTRIDQQDGFNIPSLFPSFKNKFYASSSGNNLLVYTKEKNQYKIDSTIRIEADIYDIWEHPIKEEAWISTSNGLWRLDLESFELFKNFKKYDGLKDESVFSFFKDSSSRDWIITNQNLWVFDSTNNNFYRFRKEDGLHTGQFSLFANLKDSNGKIWLGTNDGVTSFYPDSIKPYPYPSKIHLKYLRVNNTLLNSETVIDEAKIIDLKHNENTLEFGVLGITNYLPHLTQLHYLLEGYNDDWKVIENNEPISFIKVPFGEYVLKIFSTNANNLKSEIREVRINIHPPFWRTTWFLITAIIGLILFGFGVFKLILLRKLKQQKLVFDALQNERNRIASEMHDDLGGGLYSIKILIQGILDKIQSPETPNKLYKIEKRATELVENMREIIWAMDGNNDNLPDLVAYIRAFFVEFFEESTINGEAQIPTNIPDIKISGKKRRDIFLCIKECVHNIAKHSDAKQAELLFFNKNGIFRIEIRDNGKGFDLSNIKGFGNGHKNMRNRMKQIGGNCEFKNKNGTIVILEFPIS